jgi:hypothetical protein
MPTSTTKKPPAKRAAKPKAATNTLPGLGVPGPNEVAESWYAGADPATLTPEAFARLNELGAQMEEELVRDFKRSPEEAAQIVADAKADIVCAETAAHDPQVVDPLTGVTAEEVRAAVEPVQNREQVVVAAGRVMDLDEIAHLKDLGHRSPARVYGSGLEQARQALEWGYDGYTWPSALAPDATPEDWAQAQEERHGPTVVTAARDTVAEALGEKVARKDGTVAFEQPPAAKPAGITLQLSQAEGALVWATLARFGYRAFDAWGDDVAPFDYADGTALTDPVELTAVRGEALHQALEAHLVWIGKQKKELPDRTTAVQALADKVRGLLDA